jgi:dinuclear metal center YbgI/SA1388 family protein
LKLKEIVSILDSISSFELQESWDNSGVNVGDLESEIKNIYLSIDIDDELISSIEENSLVITHHPLIFSGLKSINLNSYPDRLLALMIKKSISLVAMHTNFDKTHLNRYVAREVLGAREIECRDFICYFNKSMSLLEALSWVKERFNLGFLKYVDSGKDIKRVALTTGSGGGLLDFVEAELFLTGDLKYHDAMKAKMMGINVIDIGHYESEAFFAEILADELKKYSIEVIIARVENPLKYKG